MYEDILKKDAKEIIINKLENDLYIDKKTLDLLTALGISDLRDKNGKVLDEVSRILDS